MSLPTTDKVPLQHETTFAIILAVFFAMLSACFSGLTIGLMTQDVNYLRMLIEAAEGTKRELGDLRSRAGSLEDRAEEEEEDVEVEQEEVDMKRLRDLVALERQGKFARRILDVRQDGNLLLVTLLVGNVSVNSAFSILLGDLTSSLTGFLVSTVVILLFGEIVPQAICCKEEKALKIGFLATPFLIVLETILWPICKPISFILDRTLGAEPQELPTKDELRCLIAHLNESDGGEHQLESQEVSMMQNILDFASAKAGVYTMPLSESFWLPADAAYDTKLLHGIIEAGYSRIPIIDKQESNSVLAILHAKDLLGIPLDARLTLREISSYFKRHVLTFSENDKLSGIFEAMRKGRHRGHMAVIKSNRGGRTAGFITLEDIVEAMLGVDIVDEYDLNSPKSSLLVAKGMRRDNTLSKFALSAHRDNHCKGSAALTLFGRIASPETESIRALSIFLMGAHPSLFGSATFRTEELDQHLTQWSKHYNQKIGTLISPGAPVENIILVLHGSLSFQSTDVPELNLRIGSWQLIGSRSINEIGWRPTYTIKYDDISKHSDTTVILIKTKALLEFIVTRTT